MHAFHNYVMACAFVDACLILTILILYNYKCIQKLDLAYTSYFPQLLQMVTVSNVELYKQSLIHIHTQTSTHPLPVCEAGLDTRVSLPAHSAGWWAPSSPAPPSSTHRSYG